MGSSPPEFPSFRLDAEASLPPRPYVTSVPVRPRRRVWRHVVLFALTVVSTTLVGAAQYAGFAAHPVQATDWALYANGLWYSASILAILGAHEFGHYGACRYYGVDASLPYFLPAPLLAGTLGAFIRIRQQIPGKRELFDIGIAGPIAGFIVALPIMVIGISLSRVAPMPPDFSGQILGEPLLFKAFAWLVVGARPEGYDIMMHPVAFAAWFGLLATALNLFPIGQLDGGHIAYAVLGPRSTVVTLVTVLCLVALSFLSPSWIVWTVLTVAMLVVFGPRHPRTFDEDVPLDRTRMWLAAFAALMFAVCFTPVPIGTLDLVGP